MNWAHVHIAVNHVPVVGAVFGFLLLAYATWRKSPEVQRVSMGVLVLVGCSALVTFLTGDPAGEALGGIAPRVSAELLERHCDLAALALASSLATGVCGLVALAVSRRSKAVPRGLLAAAFILSVVTLALMAWTANRGGMIRHPEVGPEPEARAPAAPQAR
jgi:hypothetical protein